MSGAATDDERGADSSALELGVYRRLFRQSTIGMMVFRWEEPPALDSFRLVATNEAAIAAGAPPDAVGKRIGEVSPHVLSSPVPARYAASLESNKALEWTIDWRSADGRTITYSSRCFPVGVGLLAVFFEDITEKHAANVELSRRLAELQRSNRDLDDFAYAAAHDLRESPSATSTTSRDGSKRTVAHSSRRPPTIISG